MKNNKINIIFLVIIAFIPTLRANDSITSHKTNQLSIFTAGATFTIVGAVSNRSFNKWEISQKFSHTTKAVDAIQYAPIVFPWAMKAIGIPTHSGWGRMATSQAISTLLMAGSVSLMKDNISSLRPDGSDMRSFPSGHSAWAYLGATMTAYELGWKSSWYSIGAYSIASAIAMQRIIDRRHLPKDVITGAGIGILSAQIGYAFGDLIWGNKQIDNYFDRINTPNKNSHSLSLINVYSIPLNKFRFNDFALKITSGFEAGLKWHAPILNNLSLASSISFQSSPIFIEKESINIYVAPLNQMKIQIAPGYRFNINKIISIDIEAGGIYSQNFSLKSHEKAISSSNNSIGGIANINVLMRITDDFSIGTNIGYETSTKELYINPSKTYGISSYSKERRNINSINIGFSTSITL